MPIERRQPYQTDKLFERLVWLRDNLWSGSQIDMARQTGVYQGSLSNILRGKRKPGRELLEKIGKHPRINTTWLLTGEGEPLLDSVVAPVAGEAALHVAKELFQGSPHDHPQCLEHYLLPVHRSLYQPSRYWIVVRDGNPLIKHGAIQVTAGDQILFDPDPSGWPSSLAGHPCIVVTGRGKKQTLEFFVGPRKQAKAEPQTVGGLIRREQRVVQVDPESGPELQATSQPPSKKAPKIVAVGIYREGGFGNYIPRPTE